MISKLPATYAALPSRQLETVLRGPEVVVTSTATSHTRRVQSAVKLVAVTVLEVGLVLSFTLLSLGIGAETHAGSGPDRPPQPVGPAPAPPPDLMFVVR